MTNFIIDAYKEENFSIIYEPKSKMTIYGFLGIFNNQFFDKNEELIEYSKVADTFFGAFSRIDYLGTMDGHTDVIKIDFIGGSCKYYTVINHDGYAVLNKSKSTKENKPVWEFEYGNLSDIYLAFKKRGIVLENDIYKEVYKHTLIKTKKNMY